MFEWVTRKLAQFFVKRALTRLGPRQFSVGSLTNAFFIFLIEVEEDFGDTPLYAIRKKLSNGYLADAIFSENWRYPCSVPSKAFNDMKLIVRHYRKETEVRSEGFGDFVLSRITLHMLRARTKERVNQFLYNSRTRFRRERMILLKELAELAMTTATPEPLDKVISDGLYPLQIFESLYGNRVYGHPNFDAEFKRFEFLLESFISSGEVIGESGKYHVDGFALATLSKHELEERRHRDQQIHNWLIFFLTAIIACSTLYSIFFGTPD